MKYPFLPLLIATTFSLSVFAQKSDLSISMLADNRTPNIRSNVSYILTVYNAGPDKATGVAVINYLPDGYGNITSINSKGIKAGNTITWLDLTIPARKNVFLKFTAKVLSSGEYENKAEIIGSDNQDPDSDPELSFDRNDLRDRRADDDEVQYTIKPIPPDLDKDKILDKDDLDDDNDGIPDTYESNGINPDSDKDGDGTPVYLDDNDENADIGDINNKVEPMFDIDGDGDANHLDTDADNDGIFDFFESNNKNEQETFRGVIVGSPLDFGKNGLYNKLEVAADGGTLISRSLLNTDDDKLFNFLDNDDDNDGIPTSEEHADSNKDGDPDEALDTDQDGLPDYLDNTTDNVASNTNEEYLAINDDGGNKSAVIFNSKGSAIKVKLYTEQGDEIEPKIKKVGNLVQLDVSGLKSGVYFIELKTNYKVDIRRMVID